MILKHKAIPATLVLLALGYAGAATFYSYLLGLSIDFPNVCPVCPNIDSFGSPTSKFIWRTITLGTLNAVLFATVAWTLIGIAFAVKRFFSSRFSQ
jgi:hypothetical protein